MKNSAVETVIGAVVIVIAAAFFTFVYKTSGAATGSGGYRVIAQFENVEGINIGSDVRMAGIKIGLVLDQSLDPQSFRAELTMIIDPRYKLPDDSSAKITSEGLLGGKFIALEPGGSEAQLKDGGRITNTQSALDLWGLVQGYMFSGKDKDKDKEQ